MSSQGSLGIPSVWFPLSDQVIKSKSLSVFLRLICGLSHCCKQSAPAPVDERKKFKNFLMNRVYNLIAVCYYSVDKVSTAHLSVVLRTLLSLAVLQQDADLVADVLPLSLQPARDETELAWLAAFCYLLQV